MLYVLYGDTSQSGRKKLHQVITAAQQKRADAPVLFVQAEELSDARLDELASAQGLFERKCIVVLDLPFAEEQGKQAVLENVKALGASENLFVLFEGEIDAKSRALLTKHAAKVQALTVTSSKKSAEPFNRFSLTDALGRRDRRALWVLFQRAKLAELADEEIHGLLFWQVKVMLLASTASSAEASGLKPFVFSKARGAARHYTHEELAELSARMVALYHDSRRGVHELPSALERLILGV